jgi:hypothetical protein
MINKLLNTLITLSLVITTTEIIMIGGVAKAEEETPMFGDLTIDRQFAPDPLKVIGMSGGSIPATQVHGGSKTQTGMCKGFVDKEPDHNLKLLSKFDYLKLLVESPSDTTIMIKGPGGIWCNDDFDSKNPGIVGEWLQGDYQIWVGSYKKGKYLPYTLKITEDK